MRDLVREICKAQENEIGIGGMCTVPIVIENGFSGVAPGSHMVEGTVKFQSERTSHDPSELSI